MDAPAQTIAYSIAGFAAIFLILGGYVISLAVRGKKAREKLALYAQNPEDETIDSGIQSH
jgi:CcmD family protein